jgi:hypothetical protein
MGAFFGAGLVVAVIILAFVLGPMLTLWALNTISEVAAFGWYIPHGWWTYLAVWVLMVVWKSSSSTTRSK